MFLQFLYTCKFQKFMFCHIFQGKAPDKARNHSELEEKRKEINQLQREKQKFHSIWMRNRQVKLWQCCREFERSNKRTGLVKYYTVTTNVSFLYQKESAYSSYFLYIGIVLDWKPTDMVIGSNTCNWEWNNYVCQTIIKE